MDKIVVIEWKPFFKHLAMVALCGVLVLIFKLGWGFSTLLIEKGRLYSGIRVIDPTTDIAHMITLLGIIVTVFTVAMGAGTIYNSRLLEENLSHKIDKKFTKKTEEFEKMANVLVIGNIPKVPAEAKQEIDNNPFTEDII